MLCFRKDFTVINLSRNSCMSRCKSHLCPFSFLWETIKTKSNIYSILNWDLGYHSVTKCDISVQYISFFKGSLKLKKETNLSFNLRIPCIEISVLMSAFQLVWHKILLRVSLSWERVGSSFDVLDRICSHVYLLCVKRCQNILFQNSLAEALFLHYDTSCDKKHSIPLITLGGLDWF